MGLGFPLGIRLTHWFNLLFITLLAPAGWPFWPPIPNCIGIFTPGPVPSGCDSPASNCRTTGCGVRPMKKSLRPLGWRFPAGTA